MIKTFISFMNEQYNEASSASHLMVVPSKAKIPDPPIPDPPFIWEILRLRIMVYQQRKRDA